MQKGAKGGLDAKFWRRDALNWCEDASENGKDDELEKQKSCGENE